MGAGAITLDVPFRPQAVKFTFGWCNTLGPFGLETGFSIGFACRQGTIGQINAAYGASNSFFAPWNDSGNGLGTARACGVSAGQGTVTPYAGINVTGWNSRSIDMTLDTTVADGETVIVEVYGGDTLVAEIRQMTIFTDGSTDTVSDLPFDGNEPLVAMLCGASEAGNRDNALFEFGVIDRDDNQWSQAYYAPWLAAGGWCRFSNGVLCSGVPFAGNVVDWEGSGTMIADGLTLNNEVPPSAVDIPVGVLLMWDSDPRVRAAVGVDGPTFPGPDTVTVGFKPQLVGVGSSGDVAGVVSGSNDVSAETDPRAWMAGGAALFAKVGSAVDPQYGTIEQNYDSSARDAWASGGGAMFATHPDGCVDLPDVLGPLVVQGSVPTGFEWFHTNCDVGWYALKLSPSFAGQQIYRLVRR